MSDITLINISIAKRFGEKVLFERNSAGVLSLIATLEKAGFEVDFHEHFLNYKYSFTDEIKHFLTLIDNPSPLVGIGCHSVHLPFVVLAVKELKKIFPEKRVILGGIGPSSLAKELLETFSFIDTIVLGEGEETIVELLKTKTDSLRDIKGLVYREKGGVFTTNVREPIRDLDSLPLPAYHKMDFEQYEIPTVITSRGCPYRCPFCSLSAFWGRKVRYRSIDSVIEELKLLAGRYGIKYIFFGDPTFVIDRDRIVRLCHRLKKENLGLRWECLVRIDCMDEELMHEMSNSSCEAVFFGLESGSDRVLKKIKPMITVDKSLDIIHKSLEYFKTVEVSLMWGFPFETLDDFKETLRISEYLKDKLSCQVQLRWLEPYPATAFYEEYKDLLFSPEELSYIFHSEIAEQRILKGENFYRNGKSIQKVCIPTNVTSIRTIIAASHIANLCRQLIQNYPHLFCDYYRYDTPNLGEKIRLAQGFSLY